MEIKREVHYTPDAELVRGVVGHGMSLTGYRSTQAVATIVASQLAGNFMLLLGGNPPDVAREIVNTLLDQAIANYQAIEAKQVRN